MRIRLLIALSLAMLLTVCGCTRLSDPLIRAETTAVPGLSMELHSATASDSGAYELNVALYYRFLDEPMLAAEYRTLQVKRDESAELATINALLAGPSASGVELTRLFPEGVSVEGIVDENGILFVTLSDALFSDGVPEGWLTMPEWREEAPVRRRLAIQSLVATITESFPHSLVQIMLKQSGGARQSLRLQNSYLLSELTGPSEPQLRDEKLILTPHNTAAAILGAYSARDYERLYKYIAIQSGDELKPSYDEFAAAAAAHPALIEYALSPGNVSPDGAGARLTADMVFTRDGTVAEVRAFPLSLVRENGVWKMTYDGLMMLLSAAERGGI